MDPYRKKEVIFTTMIQKYMHTFFERLDPQVLGLWLAVWYLMNEDIPLHRSVFSCRLCSKWTERSHTISSPDCMSISYDIKQVSGSDPLAQ